jgi:carboxypeptidase Q
MIRLWLGLTMATAVLAQEADLGLVTRIKTEAFEKSQVMETLGYLTDVYGPRLTASPGFQRAADWAVKRLQGYGVENVRQEKWGAFGRSWTLKQYSAEVLDPTYAALDAAPLAWSDATNGPVTGEILLAPFGGARQPLDPKKLEEDLDRYMAAWKGKLKGKVVMLTQPPPLTPQTQPLFARYTDKDLSDMAAAPAPAAKLQDVKELKFPDDPDEAARYQASLPAWVTDQLAQQRQEITAKRVKFLKDEGVLAVLTTGATSHDALIFAQAAGPYDAKYTQAPPTFIVTAEQYNRMARLYEKNVPVRVRLNLQAAYSPGNQDAFNLTGEIPGGAKKDELVMIGAHFDSWHSGTGATDNGAGSAVMIEVMRILKSLNVKLDRTVRIALWSGEEQGLLGSKAYVKEHFGDLETMKLQEAHARLSGYFNLDNGSGKIRGVYLQGNDAMRPIFERWLAPFRDQGVSAISIRNTGGTDHLSFDAVGLPGFQFIQDPLEYSTLTHHSNMDTLDHAQPADLMQAAAVIAAIVWDAANRPEMLPRKELPAPRPQTVLTGGGSK